MGRNVSLVALRTLLQRMLFTPVLANTVGNLLDTRCYLTYLGDSLDIELNYLNDLRMSHGQLGANSYKVFG